MFQFIKHDKRNQKRRGNVSLFILDYLLIASYFFMNLLKDAFIHSGLLFTSELT